MGMYYFESIRFQKYETKQQVSLYAISVYQKIIMFYILPYLLSFSPIVPLHLVIFIYC